MKIVRPLHVTPEEFFDFLEENALAEIVHAVGAENAPEMLTSGYVYVKNPDLPRAKVTTTIEEYEYGHVYRARTVSATDNVLSSYEVEPTEDGIKVTFYQDMESHNSKKKSIFKSFSEAVFLGRMAERLLDIQEKIYKQREGIEDDKMKTLLAARQERMMKRMQQIADKLEAHEEKRAAKKAAAKAKE